MPKIIGFDPLCNLAFSDIPAIAQEKEVFIAVHVFFFPF